MARPCGQEDLSRSPQPGPHSLPLTHPGPRASRAGQLHVSLQLRHSTAHPDPDPDPIPLPPTAAFSMYSTPSIPAVEISGLGPLSALSFARTAPAQNSHPRPPHPFLSTPYTSQRSGGPALGLKRPCLDSISLRITHPLRPLCLHAALAHAPASLWGKGTKGHTFPDPLGRSWSWSHPLSPVPAPW